VQSTADIPSAALDRKKLFIGEILSLVLGDRLPPPFAGAMSPLFLV